LLDKIIAPLVVWRFDSGAPHFSDRFFNQFRNSSAIPVNSFLITLFPSRQAGNPGV